MVGSNVLVANGEIYYVLQPRPQAGGPNMGRAIIWHHGAGGETLYSDPQYGLVNIRAAQQRLVDAGFTILSCDFAGANTWGNAANQTKITAAVTWLSTIGCRTDKVALWGTSMGFYCLATWAKNNPTKVACLAGTIPCADGQWAYTNGAGLSTVMNAAWSGNWTTNGKPTTDPSVIYASLITFPVRCWYSSDDPTVGAGTSPSFVALVNGAGGNATATSMGTGGHGDLVVPDLPSFTRFFEGGTWDQLPESAVAMTAGMIGFNSDRSGNFEIYKMASNGTGVVALTTNTAYHSWWPRISPNRKTILFYRTPVGAGAHDDYTRCSLWAMAADGTGVAQLRPAGQDGWVYQGHVEFHPGGNRLVMFGGSLAAPQIHTTNIVGLYPQAITAEPAECLDPAFSPDGTQVVFCMPASGEAADQYFRTYEIYRVPTVGGAVVRLTSDFLRDHDPYYSPNGTKVAWLTQITTAPFPGVWDIRTSNAADMGAAGGFVTPTRLVNDAGITSRPQWSADGTKIFMHRMAPAGSAYGIWSINANGTGLVEITLGQPGNHEFPSIA